MTIDALIARLEGIRKLHGGDMRVVVYDCGRPEIDAPFREVEAECYLSVDEPIAKDRPTKKSLMITDPEVYSLYDFLQPLTLEPRL